MPEFSTCLIILDIWDSFEYDSGIKYSHDNIIVTSLLDLYIQALWN